MYKTQHNPSHPRADMLGNVSVHILVAEEMLGRPLKEDEIVHHKDFWRLNNEAKNLHIMTRKEHQQLPRLQAQFLIARGLLDEFFIWWQEHKNDTNPEHDLEARIAEREVDI